MHHLSEFECGCGLVVLFLALVFIIILIASGFKVASDAKVEEAEQSVERRAERRAKQIVRERLYGCKLQVIQRIDVIEDNLKGGRV
jgi:uncharacterized membrane protein